MSVKSTFSAHRRSENGVANGTEKEEKTGTEVVKDHRSLFSNMDS